jgi:hypothetical protein
MDPEYYTTGKLMAQVLGFGSAEVNAVQKANFLAKSLDMKLRGQKKDLLDQLAVAVRQDSDEKIDKVIGKIFQFNVVDHKGFVSSSWMNKTLSYRWQKS